MEDFNTDEVNAAIKKLCDRYQSEHPSGHWYITQTGLNKVARLLGGVYASLTKKQRAVFRSDCIDCAMVGKKMGSWWYYLNVA